MSEKNGDGLKSAFDLAMERLERKEGKLAPLTDEQKKAIADIESQLKARLAEIDILSGKRLVEAQAAGDAEEIRKIGEQKSIDVARARDRAETDKRRIREGRG